MGQQNEMSIKYIGKREPWHDRLYRTGLVFDCNQVRTIPWDMARKFLRHEDLFVEAQTSTPADDDVEAESTEGSEATEQDQDDDTQALLDEQTAKNKDEKDEQTELQALYDQVNVMDKEALEDFAKNHYQQNLDKRRGVDTLRAEVVSMIDQFGAV